MYRNFSSFMHEAGCDEAGRGCLAGPVFAAAVILPSDFENKEVTDSKKISRAKRQELRTIIEECSTAWAVAYVSAAEIDEINILKASILAMHRALEKLAIVPDFIAVDGNRFIPYKNIPYTCVVKGDTLYKNIAAASILAKTYRDDYMDALHKKYPYYGWNINKGYPTKKHRAAIESYGACSAYRKSFQLLPEGKNLFFI